MLIALGTFSVSLLLIIRSQKWQMTVRYVAALISCGTVVFHKSNMQFVCVLVEAVNKQGAREGRQVCICILCGMPRSTMRL